MTHVSLVFMYFLGSSGVHYIRLSVRPCAQYATVGLNPSIRVLYTNVRLSPSVHPYALYLTSFRLSVCTVFNSPSICVHYILLSVHLYALYSTVSPSVCTIFYCQSFRVHHIFDSQSILLQYFWPSIWCARFSVHTCALYLTVILSVHPMCTI